MRRSFLIGTILILTVSSGFAEPPITDLERQRLVAHLQMTASWLEDELRGLSKAQAEFRPTPNVWTILEVLDHLVVVGPIYWKDLQAAKEVAAGPAGMMDDDDVLWYGIDRTNRETALTTEQPSRKAQDLESALKSYRTQHAQLLHYVQTTRDDLRRRVVERQNADAYQWALLISAHEQRHILQIREIKRDAKFPRQ